MKDKTSRLSPYSCRDLLNTLEELWVGLHGWPMFHDEVEYVVV